MPDTFIQHPTPRGGEGEEEGGRRGADSASSGFVDDIDNELFKYGMAGRTFRGEEGWIADRRTMEELHASLGYCLGT